MAKSDAMTRDIMKRVNQATRQVKTSGGGIGKLFLYSGKEYVEASLPTPVAMVQTNKELLTDAVRFLRNPIDSINKQVNKAMATDDFKALQKLAKNAKSDLISGKLYDPNRSRSSWGEMWNEVDDFGGFDLGNFDENGDWLGDDESSDNTSAKIAEIQDLKDDLRTQATIEAVGDSTEAIINTENANAQMSLRMSLKQHSQHMQAMENVITTQTATFELLNASFKNHFEITREAHNQVMGKLDEVTDLLTRIADGVAPKQEKAKYNNRGINPFGSNGELDIKAFGKRYLKNLDDKYSIKSTVSMMTMGMGIKDLADLAQDNPWALVGSMLINAMVPEATKNKLNKTNKNMESFIPALLAKAAERGKRYESGKSDSLLDMLLSGLDVSNRSNYKIDTAFNNTIKPAQFTTKTAKAIEEVIPMWLARIDSHIAGTPLMVYNYKTGKLENAAYTMADMERKTRNLVGRMGEGADEVMKRAKQYNFKDEKERKAFLDYTYRSLHEFGVNNTFVNPNDPDFASTLASGGNDTYTTLIKAILQSMPRDKRMQLSSEIQGARSSRDYGTFKNNQELHESGQIAAWAGFMDPELQKKIVPAVMGSYTTLSEREIDDLSNDTRNKLLKAGGINASNAILSDILSTLRKGIITYNFDIGDSDNIKLPNYVLKQVIGTAKATAKSEQDYAKEAAQRRRDEAARLAAQRAEAARIRSDPSATPDQRYVDNGIDLNDALLMQSAFNYQADAEEDPTNQNAAHFRKTFGQAYDKFKTKRSDIIGKATSGNFFGLLKNIKNVPFELFNIGLEAADSFMYKALYGDEALSEIDRGEGEPFLFQTIATTLKTHFKQAKDWFVDNIGTPVKNFFFDKENGLFPKILDFLGINKLKDKIKDRAGKAKTDFTGTKGEDGKYSGGLASNFLNGIADLNQGTKSGAMAAINNVLYGDYADTHGRAQKQNRNEKGQFTSGTHYAYGGVVGMGRKFTDKAHAELDRLMFGEGEDRNTDAEAKFKTATGELKKAFPNMAFDAGLGVVGSLFLPGGPILGAVIGSGVGLVKGSSKLQEVLFGETEYELDADGNPMLDESGKPIIKGRKDTGIISKKIQDAYKKYVPNIAMGAGLGVIGSLFLPGGPLLGGLIGAVGGLVKSSDELKQALFGKDEEEETETTDDNGKPVKKKVKVRKGGLFGPAAEYMKSHVVAPLRDKFDKVGDSIGKWFKDDIINPLKNSFKPLKDKLKDAGTQIKDSLLNIGQTISSGILKAFGVDEEGGIKKYMEEHVLKKLKETTNKFFSAIGNVIGKIIAAPFKALEAIVTGGLNRSDDGEDTSLSGKLHNKWKEHSKERTERAKNNLKSGFGEAGRHLKNLFSGNYEIYHTESTAAVAGNIGNTNNKQQQQQQQNNQNQNPDAINDEEGSPATNNQNSKNKNKTTPFKNPLKGHKTNNAWLSEIAKYTKKIYNEIEGQLGGTGWNTAYIKLLLEKQFGMGLSGDELPEGMEGSTKVSKRRGFFGKIAHGIKNKVTGIGKGIGGFLGNLFGIDKDKAKEKGGIIGKALKLPFKIIGGVASGALDIGTLLASAVTGIFETVTKGIKGAIDIAATTIKGAAQGIGEALGNIVSMFTDVAKDVVGTMTGMIRGILEFLGDTIPDATYNILSTIGGMGKGALKWAGDKLGIKLPKREKKDKKVRTRNIRVNGGHLDSVDQTTIMVGDPLAPVRFPIVEILNGAVVTEPITAVPVYVAGMYKPNRPLPALPEASDKGQLEAFKKGFEGTDKRAEGSTNPGDAYDKAISRAKSMGEIQGALAAEQTNNSLAALPATEGENGEKKSWFQSILETLTSGKTLLSGILGKIGIGVGAGATGAALAGATGAAGAAGAAGVAGTAVGTGLGSMAVNALPAVAATIGTVKAFKNGEGDRGVTNIAKMITGGAKALTGVGEALTTPAGSKVAGSATTKLLAGITNAIQKFLNGKAVAAFAKKFPKIGSLAKSLSTHIDDAILKLSGEAASQLLKKLNIAVMVATAAYDFSMGMYQAPNLLGISAGDVTTGMRLACGLGRAISGLAFGLIPVGWLSENIYKILADDEKDADLEEKQAQIKMQAEAAGMTTDEYLESINGKRNLKSAIGAIGEKVKGVGGKIKEGVGGVVSKVGSIIGTAKDKTVDFFTPIIKAKADVVKLTAKGDLEGLYKYAPMNYASEDQPLSGVIHTVNFATKMMAFPATAVSWVGHKIFDFYKGLFQKIGDFVGEANKNTKNNFNIGVVQGDIGAMWEKTETSADGNPMTPLMNVANIASKVLLTPMSAISWVGHKAFDAIKNIATTVGNTFSLVGQNLGENITTGVFHGDISGLWSRETITDENNPIAPIAKVIDYAGRVSLTPISAVSWLGHKVFDGVKYLGGRAIDTFSSIGENIGTQFNTGVIQGDIAGMWNSEIATQDDAFSGITNVINTGTKVLLTPISGISWMGHKVVDFVSNNIVSPIKTGITKISTNIDTLTTYVSNGDLKSLWDAESGIDESDGMTKLLGVTFTAAKLVLTIPTAINMFMNKISGFIEKIKTALSDTWDTLWNGDESGEGRGYGRGSVKPMSQSSSKYNRGSNEMATSGCGPTAAAMVASAYGSGTGPMEANAMSHAYGMRSSDGGTNPAFFKRFAAANGFGMERGPASSGMVQANLGKGRPVVLMGKGGAFGNGMHYLVAKSNAGRGKVNIVDPINGSTKATDLGDLMHNTSSTIYSYGKGRWGRGTEDDDPNYTGRTGTSAAQQALVNKMAGIDRKLRYSRDWDKQDPDMGVASCASTVSWAYRKTLGGSFATQRMSASSTEQAKDPRFTTIWTNTGNRDIDLSRLQPGDIMYYHWKQTKNDGNLEHAEMYAGDGTDWSHGNDPGPVNKPIDAYRKQHLMLVRRYTPFVNGTAVPYNSSAPSVGTYTGQLGDTTETDGGTKLDRMFSGITSLLGGITAALGNPFGKLGSLLGFSGGDTSDNYSGTSGGTPWSLGTTASPLPASESRNKIYNYLKSKGYSNTAIAGIMGCWQAESSNRADRLEGDYMKSFPGFNVTMASSQALNDYTVNKLFPAYAASSISINKNAYKGTDGNYYPGVGLAQWTGPRGYNLFKYAQDRGKDWRDLNTQLDFAMTEFASRGITPDKMNAYGSVADSTRGFLDGYEMYNGFSNTSTGQKAYNTRLGFANSIINEYGKGPGDLPTMPQISSWGKGNSDNISAMNSKIRTINSTISKIKSEAQQAETSTQVANQVSQAIQDATQSNASSDQIVKILSASLATMIELLSDIKDNTSKDDEKDNKKTTSTIPTVRADRFPSNSNSEIEDSDDVGMNIINSLTKR